MKTGYFVQLFASTRPCQASTADNYCVLIMNDFTQYVLR